LQDIFDAIESHATNQQLSNWQAGLDDIFDNLCEGRYGREEIRQSRDFLQSLRLSDEEQCTKSTDAPNIIISSSQSGSQRMVHDISAPSPAGMATSPGPTALTALLYVVGTEAQSEMLILCILFDTYRPSSVGVQIIGK
jgi:hypothetical protein